MESLLDVMTSSSWKVTNEKLCASCEDDDVEECLIIVLVEELCDYGEESEPNLDRTRGNIDRQRQVATKQLYNDYFAPNWCYTPHQF